MYPFASLLCSENLRSFLEEEFLGRYFSTGENCVFKYGNIFGDTVVLNDRIVSISLKLIHFLFRIHIS